MTTPQAGMTQEEMEALHKRLDKLSELSIEQRIEESKEIQKLARKMTPEQLDAFKKKRFEKMTPEQREEVAQLQQQRSMMMQASPLEILQSHLLQAFNAVSQEVAGSEATLADRIAFLSAGAEVAKGIAALQNSLIEEAKFATAQKQVPKPATGPGPGQYL